MSSGSVLFAMLLVMSGSLSAQVPNPNRRVHPAIADPVPGLVVPSAPQLAAPDNLWNHGEGFPAAGSAADRGGWFGNDDGSHVTIDDVHVTPFELCGWNPWQTYVWSDPLPPFLATPMRRFVGYLRPPAAGPLPTTHPLYGTVGAYVDQGAFEVFTPTTPIGNRRQILICIQCRETVQFPADHTGYHVGWSETYRGFFSPDGLVRSEPFSVPRSVDSFRSNRGADTVDRPQLPLLGSWNERPDYWPILAYPVLSVLGRSTTLNEQRQLQVVQAVKVMLQQNDNLNPLGPGHALTAKEVADRVFVCFVGGSNGGHQAHWATLMHPQLVHGCYAEVINPSLQRLLGEHDFGHELARRAGAGFFGATVRESDFLVWDQYVWAHGVEMHDLSYPRLLVSGKTYRPACFVVGDEDITSTGNDWVRTLSGGAWLDHGLVHSSSTFGSADFNTVAWMVVENACHVAALVPTTDPYTHRTNQYIGRNAAHGLLEQAAFQRRYELANGQTGVPRPPPHVARTRAQSFRGLDDPHEWFLGRPGGDLEPTGGALHRDDAWIRAVQPGAAGTMPGARHAMLIHDRRLFVGCTEGYVTAFVVDATKPEMPLVRVAQSPKLGIDAYALATATAAGSTSLVVGTRRHLYQLEPSTLTITNGPVELPWEVAQPRHLHVADVLSESAGDEVLFHSVHGGLVFYRASDLAPIYEWPEPGILDFAVQGKTVTILSSRGVIANVTFPWQNGHYAPQLVAVSKPMPQDYQTELPCQGGPGALALMLVNWTAAGHGSAMWAISSWTGDTDHDAVRAHELRGLGQWPYVSSLGQPIADIATCRQPAGYAGSTGIGDHALVLAGDHLYLYNQYVGRPQHQKNLRASVGGYYPFGAQAHSMVVGELVDNPGAQYPEEIVVATNTGLMWLHVDDLLTPGTELPAAYDVKTTVARGERTNVQPHTNASLSATWAMSTGPTPGLHLLDQRGNYWIAGAEGSLSLYDRAEILGIRGWDRVGMPSSTNVPIGPPDLLHLGAPDPQADVWVTRPWCPLATDVAVYEQNGGALGSFVPNNWAQRFSLHYFFAGFLLHPLGGCVVPTATGHEAWFWSSPFLLPPLDGGFWGNMLEGMRVTATGAIDGIWASTEVPDGPGSPCPYHHLRTVTDGVPSMTEQSVQAVKLTQAGYAGQTAIVLGCPGGRVRVVLPGAMRTDNFTSHDYGTLQSSEDFGFGGSALAVKLVTTGGVDRIDIWFGVILDPTPRPHRYAYATEPLEDGDVAAGAIYKMTWSPGSGFSAAVRTDLKPSAAHARGAYGVVGMKVADLFPGGNDELIVGTLSGDLIVYDSVTMAELWRTHVPGAIGFYNSIVVADLDGDAVPELYVAGSWGLWRFKQ